MSGRLPGRIQPARVYLDDPAAHTRVEETELLCLKQRAAAVPGRSVSSTAVQRLESSAFTAAGLRVCRATVRTRRRPVLARRADGSFACDPEGGQTATRNLPHCERPYRAQHRSAVPQRRRAGRRETTDLTSSVPTGNDRTGSAVARNRGSLVSAHSIANSGRPGSSIAQIRRSTLKTGIVSSSP